MSTERADGSRHEVCIVDMRAALGGRCWNVGGIWDGFQAFPCSESLIVYPSVPQMPRLGDEGGKGGSAFTVSHVLRCPQNRTKVPIHQESQTADPRTGPSPVVVLS